MSAASSIRAHLARLLPPLAFAALALAYLALSGGFADPTSAQAPVLYGRAMLGLSLLLFAWALFSLWRGRPAPEVGEEPAWIRAGFAFLLLAGFIATIFAVGFYAAVPLFLLLFLALGARLAWWRAAVIALASFLFIYLVFGLFLHMQVFAGLLIPVRF